VRTGPAEGAMRCAEKALDPSINGIATILLVLTVGISAVALRLARCRS